MSHVLVHQVNVPYRYLPRLIIAFFWGGGQHFWGQLFVLGATNHQGDPEGQLPLSTATEVKADGQSGHVKHKKQNLVKPPFLIGKSSCLLSISMGHGFHSYVK